MKPVEEMTPKELYTAVDIATALHNTVKLVPADATLKEVNTQLKDLASVDINKLEAIGDSVANEITRRKDR